MNFEESFNEMYQSLIMTASLVLIMAIFYFAIKEGLNSVITIIYLCSSVMVVTHILGLKVSRAEILKALKTKKKNGKVIER